MKHPLVVLFAVLDGQVWSWDQLVSWADRQFMKSEAYEDWLVDLSRSKSLGAGLEVIRGAMKKSGIRLPDDIGDLMTGFISMRLDRGDISEREARSRLIEVADAYDVTGVDAQSARTVALDAPEFQQMKADAERSLKSLIEGAVRFGKT